MDRSLKFFADLTNGKVNVDPNTGLAKTEFSTEFVINNYNTNDPLTITSTENKTVNYTAVLSGQNDDVFVNYMGNSTMNDYDKYSVSPDHESDIKLSNIIQWTQKNHPSLLLKPEHFVYLKDFNVYPANRLMILRRFSGPTQHNLFNSKQKPMSTMVTYYNLDKSPIDIEFNEKWAKHTGSFMEILQNVIGINLTSIPGIKQISQSSFGQFATNSNIGQELLTKIGQAMGFITQGGVPYGDPNMIYEARVRDVSGEETASGLESKVSIAFETTYIMKEINGVDAKAAMIDIIGNVVRMGTSPERFYITGAGKAKLNRLIGMMRDGKGYELIGEIISAIKDVVDKVIDKITDLGKQLGEGLKQTNPISGVLDVLMNNLEEGFNEILKTRYSRYKWKLQGVISSLTGAHTAPWHITIGNPKFPWFTCGNMVVDKIKMETLGELGYNDMFTELKVTITLTSGRSFGAKGLSELFNAGRGRIYDTPDKMQKIIAPVDAEKKIVGSPSNLSEVEQENVVQVPVNDDPYSLNGLSNTTDFSFNNGEDKNLMTVEDGN